MSPLGQGGWDKINPNFGHAVNGMLAIHNTNAWNNPVVVNAAAKHLAWKTFVYLSPRAK